MNKIKNIFLISMDAIRPDYLNIFDNTKNTQNTKNLKKILGNGVAFNNCIISNVGTPSSHVSMITGAYPFHTGVRNNFAQGMSDKVTTIQEILSSNNWITSTFVNHKHLTHLNFDKGSNFFIFHPSVEGTGTDIHPCTDHFTPAEKTTDRVIHHYSFLNALDEKQKKFFFIHYLDAHLDLGDMKNYKKNVLYVDEQIGRLYDHVEKQGELDETLWVLTADHGEGQPGETRYELTGGTGLEVFDTSIKCPLIFSWPGLSEKNVVYDDVQVRQIDIVPTILSLVDLPINFNRIDGTALEYYMNLKNSENIPDTKFAYCETFSPGWFMKAWGTTNYELTFRVHDWVSVRYDNSWKVMYNADNNKLEPLEVYNLIDDPEERVNIIDKVTGEYYIKLANAFILQTIPEKQNDVSQEVTQQMLVSAGNFSYEKNKHRTGMFVPKAEGGLL